MESASLLTQPAAWLPRRRIWGRLCDLLFLALALGAIRRTFHDAQLGVEDFHVYWQAAHRWLTGQNPYAFSAADQGFVFKYPPWLLPFFLPLGLLSFGTARILWYLGELACAAYSVAWCIRQGVPRRVALFMIFVFWWLLHDHVAAGQFSLLLLAAALAFGGPPQGRPEGLREAALAYFLSAKVFSLYTLGGIYRRYLRPAPWLWGAGLLAATHGLLAVVGTRSGAYRGIVPLYRDFLAAARSGGAELGAIIVRGQGNHGFTALVLRTLGVSSLSFASDALTSAGLALLLGALWARSSSHLAEAEKWAGWIGLGLVVHPLAWHHSFVLAYPLCALSLARALAAGRRDLVVLSFVGAALVGLFVPQVMGPTLVRPVELAGGKSWGVVLAAAALALAGRARGETT